MIEVIIAIEDSWGKDGSIRILQLDEGRAEFKVKNKGRWPENTKSDTAIVRLSDLLPSIQRLLKYSNDKEPDMMWLDGYTTELKIAGVGNQIISLVWQCDNKKRLTEEVDKLAQRIGKIRRIA